MAGAAAPFLRASKKKRVDPDPVLHEEEPATPRPNLVAADRHEVRAGRDRHPPGARARIEVDQGADVVSALDDLRHGLNGAQLVVGEAHRDKGRARNDRVGICARRAVDFGDHHVVAEDLQASNRGQDRLVLGRPGHDRAAFRQPRDGAEQREVDGFGARGHEGDLGALDTERRRRHIARAVEQCPRGASF